MIMEEFGVSSDFVSDANAAALLPARAAQHPAGRRDRLDRLEQHRLRRLAGQDPYRHHAFEQHFGLTDAHGRPKATLNEMAAFAQTLRTRSTLRAASAPTPTPP